MSKTAGDCDPSGPYPNRLNLKPCWPSADIMTASVLRRRKVNRVPPLRHCKKTPEYKYRCGNPKEDNGPLGGLLEPYTRCVCQKHVNECSDTRQENRCRAFEYPG